MIRAQGLVHRFGGAAALAAVAGVDIAVAPGEVVGFLGPNGAGKTTTIRCLLGLLRPTAGHIAIERPAGYLPEVFAPYGALTVDGYLRFMARMKRVEGTDVARVIEVVGLGDLIRRPVARLSRGQRQRVGLAQALLGPPRSLVLDEPTQGLDPQQIVDARSAVRAVADGGAAVLLSTHLLAEAAAICDRVVVIARGKVVGEERPGPGIDLEQRFLRLVGDAARGDADS